MGLSKISKIHDFAKRLNNKFKLTEDSMELWEEFMRNNNFSACEP